MHNTSDWENFIYDIRNYYENVLFSVQGVDGGLRPNANGEFEVGWWWP